jgi:hypothetical protein
MSIRCLCAELRGCLTSSRNDEDVRGHNLRARSAFLGRPRYVIDQNFPFRRNFLMNCYNRLSFAFSYISLHVKLRPSLSRLRSAHGPSRTLSKSPTGPQRLTVRTLTAVLFLFRTSFLNPSRPLSFADPPLTCIVRTPLARILS